MNEYLQYIYQQPLASLAVIANLTVIECLLSVDNAAVIATLVKDLPKEQGKKALLYGIFGAYLFRAVALVLAAAIIKIWWLKPLGGLYLLYLFIEWHKGVKIKAHQEGMQEHRSGNKVYNAVVGVVGSFWATVVVVELMDMAFSIDNVFAAVAFNPNIILVCTGIFIGILAMRFVANWFVKLIQTHAFLERSAYWVIGILGLKLVFSLYQHFLPQQPVSRFLDSKFADMATSGITIFIFVVPFAINVFRKNKI